MNLIEHKLGVIAVYFLLRETGGDRVRALLVFTTKLCPLRSLLVSSKIPMRCGHHLNINISAPPRFPLFAQCSTPHPNPTPLCFSHASLPSIYVI